MLPKLPFNKKLLFSFLILFAFSLMVTRSVFAFYTPKKNYRTEVFEKAVFDTTEMNLESFVNETFKATLYSVFDFLAGCTTCDEETKKENPGLLGVMPSLMASVYANPPASGVEYLADLGKRIGIVTPAYAQAQEGIGYRALVLIRPIWQAFRDVAYVFFVIIFVITGFAIMFRVKISPQAVITIQSALPKIIIALILVTFSYAIAGLLIDLMYVSLFLVGAVFRTLLVKSLVYSIPWEFGWEFRKELAEGISKLIMDWYDKAYTILFGGLGALYFKNMATMYIYTLGTLITNIFLLIVLLPISAPLSLILLILLIFIFIRILWALLKAYVMVILAVIFGPFQIMLGVLPGSRAISGWFKNLIGNLAVFPVIATMLFLASYFSFAWIFELPKLIELAVGDFWNIFQAIISGNFHKIVELIISKSFETPWQVLSILITPFVGLAILFMAPKAADMIKAFLTGEPFGYGTAIGEAFGPARWGAGIVTRLAPGAAAEKFIYEPGATRGWRRHVARVGETTGVWKKPESA